MTISGSSFRAFISKLKSQQPALKKLSRSQVSMRSNDSFELVTAATTKGIDAHLSELVAAGHRVHYTIPERYFNDPKLQNEFIEKLIATEKPAAINQYFTQLANRYPVSSLTYHDVMQDGLALQERIYLKQLASNPVSNFNTKHVQERRDAKKQLQRIRYEQHQLSTAFETKLPEQGITRESESLTTVYEDMGAISGPLKHPYDIPHAEPQTHLNDEHNQTINSFKDELDTIFKMPLNKSATSLLSC